MDDQENCTEGFVYQRPITIYPVPGRLQMLGVGFEDLHIQNEEAFLPPARTHQPLPKDC